MSLVLQAVAEAAQAGAANGTVASRRPDQALPSSPRKPRAERELCSIPVSTLISCSVAPERLKNLLAARLCNHSAVALAELTHPFGGFDPGNDRTGTVLTEISGVIADMPAHRLTAPSSHALGEAGVGWPRNAAGGDQSDADRALRNQCEMICRASSKARPCAPAMLATSIGPDQLLPGGGLLFDEPSVTGLPSDVITSTRAMFRLLVLARAVWNEGSGPAWRCPSVPTLTPGKRDESP